jgi:uncharacterized protein YbjT (DUF2867 family)
VPYTILRATQFHDLLRVVFAGAAKLPVMFVPDWRFQPIDVRDVAARILELSVGDPVGRAGDIGGPEVRDATDLARTYLAVTDRRRLVVPVRLRSTPSAGPPSSSTWPDIPTRRPRPTADGSDDSPRIGRGRPAVQPARFRAHARPA